MSGSLLCMTVRVIQPSQSRSECSRIEVHEEGSRVASELQVSDRLGEMDWEDAFDRFHLHDDAFFHEQVYFQAALESMAFVLDRDIAFPLDAEVCLQQLEREAFTVDGFQQSRSERSMHLNGTADDLFGERLDVGHSSIHVLDEQHKVRRSNLLRISLARPAKDAESATVRHVSG